MKNYLPLLIFLLHACFLFGQQASRPKIGLTLSGGGAKGLAHIGILKAIDSAGINIDYITGTSMGSIIGSLYAIGYSGADIERIARNINWDILLSNQSLLRAQVMQEKEEYGRYAVELPWVNHAFHLSTGVLEAEELWLKLSELFFPVKNIKDFNRFSIPFACIAADVATGEGVLLDSGEIVTALRASMAIPTIFTAVDYNGRSLVDGGVVRNFPVRDVKKMGADIVIGSRVALGLQPREKLNNPLQILMQIAFFKEAEDSKKEIPLCDIYIHMPLENYTAGSFNRSAELLKIGLKKGRELYPSLKKLKDSLDNIYGKQALSPHHLPDFDSVLISSVEIKGLKKTTEDFFLHMMRFEKNRRYSAQQLSKMIRRVFGTRYYNRIVYSLQYLPEGSYRITFNVIENPVTFAKLGIHFNKFTGISLIANLTTRNFFTPHSRSLITVNIGENFRARAGHLQYLGRGKNVALNMGIQYDQLSLSTYENFKKDGEYGTHAFKADSRIEYSANRKFTLGVGSRYEWIKYRPSISSAFDISGSNELMTSYFFLSVNTLDRAEYPKKGIRLDGEMGWVFNQTPKVTFYSHGDPIGNLDSLGTEYNNYHRIIVNGEGYLPLTSRLTAFSSLQTGINFNYRQNILNDFSIGGMTRSFRNQLLFSGLEENSISTPSAAALEFGMRLQIFNNVNISARANGLLHNFISTNNIFQKPKFLSGYALSFGYNFALGPLDISAMYCDQSKKIRSYINLGIGF